MSHEQLCGCNHHCGMVRACGQDIKLEDLERGGLFEVSHLLEHSEYGHQPHIQGRSAPPLRVLMARLLWLRRGRDGAHGSPLFTFPMLTNIVGHPDLPLSVMGVNPREAQVVEQFDGRAVDGHRYLQSYTRLTPHIAVSDARFVDIGVECDITLEVYQSVDLHCT